MTKRTCYTILCLHRMNKVTSFHLSNVRLHKHPAARIPKTANNSIRYKILLKFLRICLPELKSSATHKQKCSKMAFLSNKWDITLSTRTESWQKTFLKKTTSEYWTLIKQQYCTHWSTNAINLATLARVILLKEVMTKWRNKTQKKDSKNSIVRVQRKCLSPGRRCKISKTKSWQMHRKRLKESKKKKRRQRSKL